MELSRITASEVKEIAINMIKKHLEWVVVWGGVFGGLIGIISFFVVQ